MRNYRKVILTLFVIFGVLVLAGGIVNAESEETILRITQSFPTDIDPATGNDFSSTRALTMIYDTLVYPDVKGNPQPNVAKSWEYLNDGKEWVFTLREDIKFHNGDKLTAEDVKFSMDRFLTIGQGWSYLFLKRVEKAEVIDDYQIKITLKKPFGPFPYILYKFFILNKDQILENTESGLYDENGDYGKNYLISHDAGSGPYKLKEFPKGEYLLLERNKQYWGFIEEQAPDYVKLIGTTEPVTVRTMMKRKELEISDQWQSQQSLEALDKIEGVEIAATDQGGILHYMIHTRKPPTDDIYVRKAMAWATDYEAVTEYILPGYRQGQGPVSQSIPGHNADVFQYHLDLEKAEEVLKKSKYYGELEDYPIEICVNTDVPFMADIALMFLTNFKKIGLNAKIMKAPYSQIVNIVSDQETSPHLLAMQPSSDYPEAGAMLETRYSSATVANVEQNEWLLSDEYDNMLDDAFSIVDKEKRFEKYAEIQEYIVELCPTLFLADDYVKFAFHADYVDWPLARGEGRPLLGPDLDARWIKIDAEKQPDNF